MHLTVSDVSIFLYYSNTQKDITSEMCGDVDLEGWTLVLSCAVFICSSVHVSKISSGSFVRRDSPFSKHLSDSKCIVSAISSLRCSLHSTMPHNPRAKARVREYLRGSGTYLYVKIKYRCHLTRKPTAQGCAWLSAASTKGDRNLHFYSPLWDTSSWTRAGWDPPSDEGENILQAEDMTW